MSNWPGGKPEYIQAFSPDTCGCVLHVAIDPALIGTPDLVHRYVTPQEASDIFEAHQIQYPEKTIAISKQQWRESFPAKLCAAHEVHGHSQARYDAVLEENQRKNKVVHTLEQNIGIKSATFMFSFDADRRLTISHEALSVESLPELQATVDSEHGQGKVVLKHG